MSNKPAIPSWQRTSAATTTTSTPSEQETSSDGQANSSSVSGAEPSTEKSSEEQDAEGKTLLEQASRFLEDPAIRDAPRERKVTFLESKGVRSEEIEELLGKAIAEDATPDITEAGARAWSTVSVLRCWKMKSSHTNLMQAPPKPSETATPRPQPRDVAPIVTYPEFLAQPTQQPPLITTRRLVNTAYITGGIMATMYGLSKYLIAPMAENMVESRHDFASHAQDQLEELNKRLAGAASVDPASTAKSKLSDVADDVSEADSDPTELFHRDYGTQTSPSLSRRPSISSTTDENPVVTGHENRLKILTSHLRELESTHSNDTASKDSLKTKLSDLTTYLSEMSYQNQFYSGMGGLYGGNYGLPKTKDGKDDQVEVLKGDIRAVKGVFLSARNFPAGGRSSMPMARAGG